MKSKKEQIQKIITEEIELLARRFEKKHAKEVDNPEGTINAKKNDPFSASWKPEMLFYTSIGYSLNSMTGSTLQKISTKIAQTFYDGVSTKVGKWIVDFYLIDKNNHFLIELKKGGNIDVKKVHGEKQRLIDAKNYLIKTISHKNIKIYMAVCYNMYGEGATWKQQQVLHEFDRKELLIGSQFWNFICKSPNGYRWVLDAYKENFHYIQTAISSVKKLYLLE